jgi:oligopeptidase B
VIQGGSAGGLLMGAVVNMRPELFKAAIVQVPFVDVINTMLDESLPLTTSEFIEWGNPKEKAAFDYMIKYSPYDNIKAQKYPAMLIEVSLNDSQVPYWEGAKFAAKIREMKTDDNVLLLKTNLGAGHGGASGRYDRLKEIAFDYAFALSQVGINKYS